MKLSATGAFPKASGNGSRTMDLHVGFGELAAYLFICSSCLSDVEDGAEKISQANKASSSIDARSTA